MGSTLRLGSKKRGEAWCVAKHWQNGLCFQLLGCSMSLDVYIDLCKLLEIFVTSAFSTEQHLNQGEWCTPHSLLNILIARLKIFQFISFRSDIDPWMLLGNFGGRKTKMTVYILSCCCCWEIGAIKVFCFDSYLCRISAVYLFHLKQRAFLSRFSFNWSFSI